MNIERVPKITIMQVTFHWNPTKWHQIKAKFVAEQNPYIQVKDKL